MRVAGATFQRLFASQNSVAHIAGKAAVDLAHAPAEQVEHRSRKRKFAIALHDVGAAQVVGDQEQRHVADGFRRRRHLHDVAEELIARRHKFGTLPASATTGPVPWPAGTGSCTARPASRAGRGLSRRRARGFRTACRTRGPRASTPRWRRALRRRDCLRGACSAGFDERVEIRLRRAARHRGHRGVGNVEACLGGVEDRRGLHAAGVVRVEMDRQAGFLAKRFDELGGRVRLAQSGHVFDGEDVCAQRLQLSARASRST